MSFLIKYCTAIQTHQLDVPLQLIGSVAVTLLGYYIINKAVKPKDNPSRYFTVLYAFSISETLIIIRKIIQFYIDFFMGTNLMQTDSVSDDHWFFRIFGFGMSPLDQRPVMDMGEDFLLGTLGTLLSAIGMFIYIGIKNKKTDKNPKISFSERCALKFAAERHKLSEQTNLWDILLWWCVRALMLHAFITMENRAEATLLLVNFLGTIAISVIHIISPADSFLGRIDYRIQTLLSVMVFWGSYGGNYIFLYAFIKNYDKKLHFLSGVICVLAAYYLACAFIDKKSKGSRVLVGVFAATFSLMIIPVHEMTEFVGDFLWGTVNQGYRWIPEADSTFYQIFGLGAENISLNPVFDTMNDALFAASSTVIAMIPLSVYLLISGKINSRKICRIDTQKETVNC